MTVCSDIADYEWLTGNEACGLLNDLREDAAPLHQAIERLRRHISPQRAHLVVEQLDLRRRAAAKFSQADRMFFTRIGLEQATDEWIAAYKAARIVDQSVADLCCGIGGDLLALAGQGTAIGIDQNPIAAHFAAVNTGATTRTADAAKLELHEFTAWHIDPDRRSTGRRTTSLEFCEPNLDAIDRLLAQQPNAAIKLASATKVPDAWADRCELEWISRDRECRQQVVWHGNLAHSPGAHRATVITDRSPPRSGEGFGEGRFVQRTFTGVAHQPIPLANVVDRYIFDIDPAVLAAGLKGAIAAEHNLTALSNGPTYLTGPRTIDDPALACFEVLEVIPLQLRKLASFLCERSIGQLEIKKRGLDVDPEKLRHDLKLHGNNTATLLLTQVAARPTAILARRVVVAPTPPNQRLLKSNPSLTPTPTAPGSAGGS